MYLCRNKLDYNIMHLYLNSNSENNIRKLLFSLLMFILCSVPLSAQIDNIFWFAAPEISPNHAHNPITFCFTSFSTPAQAPTQTSYMSQQGDATNRLYVLIFLGLPDQKAVVAEITAASVKISYQAFQFIAVFMTNSAIRTASMAGELTNVHFLRFIKSMFLIMQITRLMHPEYAPRSTNWMANMVFESICTRYSFLFDFIWNESTKVSTPTIPKICEIRFIFMVQTLIMALTGQA